MSGGLNAGGCPGQAVVQSSPATQPVRSRERPILVASSGITTTMSSPATRLAVCRDVKKWAGWSGRNRGTVSISYAVGTVSSDEPSGGGLIGKNEGAINDSLWDTRTSGQGTAIGQEEGVSSGVQARPLLSCSHPPITPASTAVGTPTWTTLTGISTSQPVEMPFGTSVQPTSIPRCELT